MFAGVEQSQAPSLCTEHSFGTPFVVVDAALQDVDRR